MTALFLKKCVKVPKVKLKEQRDNTEDFERSRILKQVDKMRQNPFKRGAMRFEDYNYNMYNPYILVDSQQGLLMQKKGGYT